MGNQITAIAPTQILPLESYFSELQDYGKPTRLGSTRFMKVARTTYRDGSEVVVKVFAKNDPSLQLKIYEKRLHDLQVKLHGIPNVQPFLGYWASDRAAYLVRQYIHYNLYDRISTRPFLSVIEKKWIVFQLLKALEDCHSKKIFHGDIKTENVMLTGWHWVILTDFANFKPTLLPADNPADYAFFFDTSRRRTCYIAPERFVHAADFGSYSPDTTDVTTLQRNKHYAPLTAAMDIFSLGCVIAELFLDGQHLFDLSQLLDYCVKDYNPEQQLKKIPDKNIRRLVRHMIQVNPKDRLKAEGYLAMYKGSIFPNYFYSFLHGYLQSFTTASQLTPDQCIKKLYGDIQAILANLMLTDKADNNEEESGVEDVLVIVLSAITSHVRSTQFAASKLQVLEMMKTLGQNISDKCVLERIVPYLHLMVKDPWASVRAEAIRTLTFCLNLVKKVPRSELNLFQEYILPAMMGVPRDADVQVRIALAECVADLGLCAHRFLELAQLLQNQEATDDSIMVQYQVQGSYDHELSQLQDTFQSIIVHLLSDSDSNVKRGFLRCSAGKLCGFFGPQKSKEVILSHMITFLNDKANWELHAAYFDAIVDVATQIGYRSLAIVEALIQQGLSDPEESVICGTISAMTALCERGLFDLRLMMSALKQIVSYLIHPDIWARYAAVGFVLAVAKQLDEVDVLCYVIPEIRQFLSHKIMSLDDELVLLNALKDPIPRPVLDFVLKQQNIEKIFECLVESQMNRTLSHHHGTNAGLMDATRQQILRKMITLGMNDEHEKFLLILREHLMKQHSNKQQTVETDAHTTSGAFKGVIELTSASLKSIPLVYHSQTLPSAPPSKSRRATAKTIAQAQAQNEEWGLMFGEESAVHVNKSDNKSLKLSPSLVSKLSPKFKRKNIQQADSDLSMSIRDFNALERVGINSTEGKKSKHRRSRSDGANSGLMLDSPPSLVRVEQTTCMENLRTLLDYKRGLYVKDMQCMDKGYIKLPFYQCSSGWSPKGQLVAHIHDHMQSVNKLCVLPDSTLFASFSDDCTVKLWDVQKMDGLHVINKPRLTYSQEGSVKSGCFCMSNQSIASASTDGSIHVYSIESGKQKALKGKQFLNWSLDCGEYGNVVDMSEFTSGGQNLLTFVTTKGRLCGLDLRAPGLAWDLQNNNKYGLMMCMAVDPFQNWVALGTSLGYHIIWDMRFQLPIRHWQHEGHGKPYIHRVYQLSPHPSQPSSLISAVSGNNEVSVWDMETANRRQMMWASPAQPFTCMTDNPSQHATTRSLYTFNVGNAPVVVTGGSDRHIRLWNLVDPAQCACVVRPHSGSSPHLNIRYSSQVIEGVEVTREIKNVPKTAATSSQSQELPQAESHMLSHVDYITALAVTPYKQQQQQQQQQFIISASHDGVIKLWK